MLIDTITLDMHTQTFTMEGAVSGTFTIVSDPTDRGTHNLRFLIVYSLEQYSILSVSIY